MKARLKESGQIVDVIGPDRFKMYFYLDRFGDVEAIDNDQLKIIKEDISPQEKTQFTINMQKPKRVTFEF